MVHAMPAQEPARHSILVVGSVNMDLVLRLPRMPHVGESLIGLDHRRIPGGKGANQAVALARLGARAVLAGRLGADKDGDELLDFLVRHGIATECLCRSQTAATGLAVVALDGGGNNWIAVYPGANNELTGSDVKRAFAGGPFDAVLMQLEVPDEAVIAAFRCARDAAIPVFLDAGPARSFALEELQGIDVVSPNETEVLALTGIEVKSLRDAESAAAMLMARANAKAVVIKLGAWGSLLRTRDGSSKHFPAAKVQAIDTTGAGDAFTAALLMRFLDTADFSSSVEYANLAGALATTRLGAQPSMPTASEIDRFRCASDRNGDDAKNMPVSGPGDHS
jgi:ribokinase